MAAKTEPVTLPATIAEALDFDFTGWSPDPGAKVSGTVVSKSESSEGDWGTYTILNVITDDGEGVAIHCFHTLLRGLADSAEAGDRVGVKYKGTHPSKVEGRSPYADYNVILQRAEANRPALSAG